MFCTNCGSKLPEGARFCSVCGARVAEVFEVPDVEQKVEKKTESFEFTAKAPDPETVKPVEAPVKKRVTFDWSNVIDEPQKKVVPDIKSPWATTGGIDEKAVYSEMKPSGERSRTMSFIDVLKAEKEQKAQEEHPEGTPAPEVTAKAEGRPFEYTEVLDPGFLEPVKPVEEKEEMPQLHIAPLYEDVDEPVVTPFDVTEKEATDTAEELPIEEAAPEVPSVMEEVGISAEEIHIEAPEVVQAAPVDEGTTADEAAEAEEHTEKAEAEAPAEEPAAEIAATEPEMIEEAHANESTEPEIEEEAKPARKGWFDLPDFLKPREDRKPFSAFTEEEPETVPAPAEEAEVSVEEEVFEEPVFEETEVPEPEEIPSEEPEVVSLEEEIFEEADYDDLTAHEMRLTAELDNIINSGSVTADDAVEEVQQPEEIIYEGDLYSTTEDEYLDIYTERSAEPVRGADIEEAEEPEEDEPVDEKELFEEMDEIAPKHTGMTIVPPADKESEIEALKKRLAELMGTSWEEPTPAAEPEVVEKTPAAEPEVVEEAPAEEPVVVIQEPEIPEEEPVVVVQELEIPEEEPVVVVQEPEIPEEEPVVVVQAPEIQEEEPEIAIAEPEIVIPEPELEAAPEAPAEEPVIEEAAPEVSVEDAYLDENFAAMTQDVTAKDETETDDSVITFGKHGIAFEEDEIVFDEPEVPFVQPEIKIEEPEVAALAPEIEVSAPEVTIEEPAPAAIVDEADAAPETSVEDDYLVENDYLDGGFTLTAEDLEAAPAAEVPAAPAEEPEIELIAPEIVAEEPEIKIEVPEAAAEEPEAVVPEIKVEEPVVEAPAADVVVSEPVVEAVPEPAPAEEPVTEPAAEEHAPKTIDDFLAAILREGAAQDEPAPSGSGIAADIAEISSIEPKVTEPEPVVEAPEINIEAPEAAVEIPEVKVEAPEISAVEPEIAAEVPEVAVEMPEVKVEVPEITVEEPDVNIAASEIAIEVPKVSVEEPKEPEIVIEAPAEPEPAPAKASDALSIEDLEQDLFGTAPTETTEFEATKKIDKFYTLYRKNEEFQRLLDEEYNKLKAAGGPTPEPAIPETAPKAQDSQSAAPAEVKVKKVEDATIYQEFDLEKEAARLKAEQEAAEAKEAADAGADKDKVILGAAAAATPAAVAVAAEKSKKEKKKDKKKEKKNKKAVEAEDFEYEEEVEKGGGFLTVLAVIIAILLIILLGVILVLNFMPDSSLALRIDSIIENITSHFTVVDVMGSHFLL